jgi:uncharacterized protein
MAILKESDIPQVTLVEVHTKAEVMQVIRDNLDNFQLFGVSEVGLFGSFVRSEATEESDVDLVVNLENYSFKNLYNLRCFANKLFKNRSADIIIESSLNEDNGRAICREVEYV